jgi:hypothetical protein
MGDRAGVDRFAWRVASSAVPPVAQDEDPVLVVEPVVVTLGASSHNNGVLGVAQGGEKPVVSPVLPSLT